jgi:hypothetical protein
MPVAEVTPERMLSKFSMFVELTTLPMKGVVPPPGYVMLRFDILLPFRPVPFDWVVMLKFIDWFAGTPNPPELPSMF